MAIELIDGPSFGFVHALSPIWFGFDGGSGVDHFKITLYAEAPEGAGYEVVSIHTEYPDMNWTCAFNLRYLLEAYSFPSMVSYGATISAIAMDVRKFKLDVNTYLADGSPDDAYGASEYTLIYGGINFQKFKGQHFFSDYLPALKPFFTWQPNNQHIDRETQVFVTYLFISGVTFSLKVKLYYDNGTNETVTFIPGTITATGGLYVFPVGYAALALNSYETGGDTIIKYDVWLDWGADTNTPRTYLLENRYWRNRRRFNWSNTIGGLDAMLCTGNYIEEYEYTGDDALIYVPSDYDVGNGQEEMLYNEEQGTFTASTGWKTKAEIDHFRDALLSIRLKEDDGQQFLPIRIDRGTVRTFSANDKMFAIQFKYKQLFKNEVYTGPEYDNTVEDPGGGE